jgi:nucleotide-binding universal stress UspA family protein
MCEASESNQGGPAFPPKRILLAIDGSENSKRASRAAIALAKAFGSELRIIHVLPTLSYMSVGVAGIGSTIQDYYNQYYEISEKQGKHWIDDVLTAARLEGVKTDGEILRPTSSVVYALIQKAEKDNSDLIVIGTRGLGGFKKLLLGSVSSGVIGNSKCNVLIIR